MARALQAVKGGIKGPILDVQQAPGGFLDIESDSEPMVRPGHQGFQNEEFEGSLQLVLADHTPEDHRVTHLLKRGDFLLANEVCDAQGQSLRIDLQLPATDGTRGPRVYADKLVSIQPCPRRPGDKEACGRTSGAMAADVASYAVAEGNVTAEAPSPPLPPPANGVILP